MYENFVHFCPKVKSILIDEYCIFSNDVQNYF